MKPLTCLCTSVGEKSPRASQVRPESSSSKKRTWMSSAAHTHAHVCHVTLRESSTCTFCACATFLDFVTQKVNLLSAAHATCRTVHANYLQVGCVGSLWGQKQTKVVTQVWLSSTRKIIFFLEKSLRYSEHSFLLEKILESHRSMFFGGVGGIHNCWKTRTYFLGGF